jgi:hypothetical protein
MADPTLSQFLQRPAAQQEMLGAEPTGQYAKGRMIHDYADAGLSGATSLGSAGLATMMASDPTWFWRLVGAPAMGALSVGSGAAALDYKDKGDVYRRYMKQQPD